MLFDQIWTGFPVGYTSEAVSWLFIGLERFTSRLCERIGLLVGCIEKLS